jgi:hypothetical protein
MARSATRKHENPRHGAPLCTRLREIYKRGILLDPLNFYSEASTQRVSAILDVRMFPAVGRSS